MRIERCEAAGEVGKLLNSTVFAKLERLLPREVNNTLSKSVIADKQSLI